MIISTASISTAATATASQINLTKGNRFRIAILRERYNKLGPCQWLSGGIILDDNAVNRGIVPGDGIFLVSVQGSDGSTHPLEMFHLGPIGQIGLGPSLDFFGLHELGLDFPLDLHRQTGEEGAVVIHALEQLSAKFSDGALWTSGVGGDLDRLVVIQVGFHVREDDGRIYCVPKVEQGDASYVRTVDVV
jgi:hypothetical protein